MTHQANNNRSEDAIEMLIQHGPDGLVKALKVLLDATMRLERERYLKAKPYERTEGRETYANGYKPKTLKTRMGAIELQVPQTRDDNFYPSSIEKGLRSERALKVALAEMYIRIQN
jgi:putative transposase